MDVSEPREAYLTLQDGERVDCLLEKINDHHWQATPVRDVHIDEVHQAYVDLLPGKSSISFVIQGEEE